MKERQLVPEPSLFVDKLQVFLGKYKDAIKSGHGDTMTATWAVALEKLINIEYTKLKDEIALSIIEAGSLQNVKGTEKRLLVIWLDEFWHAVKGANH